MNGNVRKAVEYAEKCMAANGMDMQKAARESAGEFDVPFHRVVKGLERDFGNVTMDKYDEISNMKLRESKMKRSFKNILRKIVKEELVKEEADFKVDNYPATSDDEWLAIEHLMKVYKMLDRAFVDLANIQLDYDLDDPQFEEFVRLIEQAKKLYKNNEERWMGQISEN